MQIEEDSLIPMLELTAFLEAPKWKDGPQVQVSQDKQSSKLRVTSYSATVQPSNWTAIGTYGQEGFGYVTRIKLSAITETLLRLEKVQVYVDSEVGTLHVPFIANRVGFTSKMIDAKRQGEFVLYVFQSDYETQVPAACKIKVLLFKGSGKLPPSLDLDDYDKVAKCYGLSNK